MIADKRVDALHLISRYGCTTLTTGSCRDIGSGRTRGARYSSEAWCDACVAMDALEASPALESAWQVVEVKSDGEYGDGGPDSSTGFTSYAIADADGRILFDSLNCDDRVSEIHEEFDDEDGHRFAWDEASRKRAELIVARMNAPLPPAKSAADIEGERIDRSLAEWESRNLLGNPPEIAKNQGPPK